MQYVHLVLTRAGGLLLQEKNKETLPCRKSNPGLGGKSTQF